MDSALPNREFYRLNKGKHSSEILPLPNGEATVFVSTHFEISNSNLSHYHNEPHLTFILSGGVLDKRKSFEAEKFAGELLFFHAGEPHQTVNKIFPTKYFTLQLGRAYFRQNPFIEAKLKASSEGNPDAKLSLIKLYKELSLNDEFSKTAVEMLFADLAEDKKSLEKAVRRGSKKIHELLNDNWNAEISLEDLSRAANVHRNTISKYFPRFFNCTLGEYRRKLRVEKSLSLIKTSRFSLTEIAHECGFYDHSHFTAAFKEFTGFRPKEFKKII